MTLIHPTAIIDASAEIAAGVSVGAYSVIGPRVSIGADSWIGPHVVINGPTRIGRENKIFQFASVGEMPQDLKFAGEESWLEIGDRNTIREFATINRGTGVGGGITRIGSDNLLMAYIHIAHDCIVGNHVILSNNASLAGHVTVADHAILGGFTLVHQFCAIGQHVFAGMGSAIAKDVPPYLIVSGAPAEPHGLNKVGLKRRDFSDEQLLQISRAYKVLYRQGLSLEEAKAQLQQLGEESEAVRLFAEFLQQSSRSIIR
ncbi:MAG: acyl-ACP--UDP-N-acetylglucosamine O-acyltransferase [Gammaproteobacteria bacterium]|nr:acyl-ACP--UDP-N-acetylglucosamine O-acyltransferase [Gammaproteobacteria bacterium]